MKRFSFHEGVYMRKASLLLLAILLPLSLYASSGLNVGIEGGYTMGFYDQRGGERPFREFSMGHAFELAIPVEYRVNGWFSVASGLRYIGKPYNMAEDTTAAGGFDFYSSRNVSHFLEVPVSARFSLGNGTMRGFLGAGAYIGVRFLSTESGRLNSQGFLTTAGTDPGFWGASELNPSSDNLFDAGLLAEAGFGCRLGGGELIISARYQYSFTSLDREYQKGLVYRYIDTLSVTAGYSFSIGGGK